MSVDKHKKPLMNAGNVDVEITTVREEIVKCVSKHSKPKLKLVGPGLLAG